VEQDIYKVQFFVRIISTVSANGKPKGQRIQRLKRTDRFIAKYKYVFYGYFKTSMPADSGGPNLHRRGARPKWYNNNNIL